MIPLGNLRVTLTVTPAATVEIQHRMEWIDAGELGYWRADFVAPDEPGQYQIDVEVDRGEPA